MIHCICCRHKEPYPKPSRTEVCEEKIKDIICDNAESFFQADAAKLLSETPVTKTARAIATAWREGKLDRRMNESA